MSPHPERAECENKARGTKTCWSLTMHEGASENRTIVRAVRLRQGWELLFFLFFSPTVTNLTVHSLLQFNHSSHCQEFLHHPPPPSTCSTRRIVCIMHICTLTFHRHQNSVYNMIHCLSGFWKGARTAASSAYPL